MRRSGRNREGPEGLDAPVHSPLMAPPTSARPPEAARVSFAHALEPALWAGLLAATLAALVLVVRSGLLPEQRPLTHALAFWLWFVVVAVPAGAIAATLAWTSARVTHARRLAWLPEAMTRAAALVVVAVLLLQNRRPVRLVLAGLDGPARHRLGLAVALVAATAALVLLAVLPARRRAWARAGGALAVGAFIVASFPPSLRDRLPPASASDARPAAAHRQPQRFLLFGIDGADWRYIDALVARGDLPNLAALRARGAWGPLGTLARSSSPIIWNTIATGQPPEVHGIDGFTVYLLRGIADPLPARVMGPKGIGFRRLRDWLEDRGHLYQIPIPSSARRVPAYWNVANRLGSPVAVLNWWATWPAEPIAGSMVSERMYFWRLAAGGNWAPSERLTWPADLGPRLAPLVMRPEEVGWTEARPFLDVSPGEYAAMVAAPSRAAQGEFRALYSMFETNRRLALALLEQGRTQAGPAPDALVLDRTVDIACHAGLRESELVPPHPGSTPAARRLFGRLVSEAYRRIDRALGEVMAAFGEGNVVVVSDHGFVLMGDPRDRHSFYHHTDGPEGIFVAAGPAFRPGRVEGLTVYDIMPMLLHLKGFPVAQDLPGRVPLQVFTDAFRAQPPATIASYGGREADAIGPGARAVDDEVIERLRALGYVK
jgi:hypothetical protein